MAGKAIVVLALVAALGGCGGPDILKAEPPGGAMSKGDSVLVDDGRCPKGQLSKVTAPATLTSSRSYACVAKP